MINFNANVSSAIRINPGTAGQPNTNATGNSGFSDVIKSAEKQISNVDDSQQASNVSIQDLLTGKTEDITTVVSEVAKADMSFKLLVGVRNKLIEAYKQTMNMPI